MAIIGFLLSGLASPAQVEAATLPSGITHHWKHADGSGTTIADKVGNANLSLQGTATNFWDRKDVNGDAVGQYNGSDNRADDSGGNVAFPTGDFWVIAAIRIDEGTTFTSHQGIVSYRANTALNGIDLLLESGQAFRFVVDDRDGSNVTVLDFGLQDELWGAWVIVQAGFDSSSGAVFLRVQEREVTDTGATIPPDPAATFFIGADRSGGDNFQGRIGDVVWYEGKFPTAQERQDAFDALWSRYNGSGITVSIDDEQLDPTKENGPYDGERLNHSRGSHTLLMTGDNNIYGTEYINRSPDGDQVRAARLNSSLAVQEDVQANTEQADAVIGHRGPAIGVDGSGNVVLMDQPDGTWSAKHTTTATDLSTLTATDRPSQIAADDVLTKPRIFYDSFTDKLFMLIEDESQGSDLTLFEYDAGTNIWSNVGNHPLLTGGSDKYTHSGMAFASGEMYITYSTNLTGDGYKSAHVQIIKSTDGGDNWTDLVGNAVTLPLGHGQGEVYTQVVPEARSSSVPESTERPNLVIDTNGNPLIVAPWRNLLRDANNMSWWLFRWDPTAETFVRDELVSTSEDVFSGFYNLLKKDEEIIFVYLDPADDILKVLATTDDGNTWTRWILDDVSANPAAISGDQRAPAVDGVYRVLSLRHDDTNLDSATTGDSSKSTIYEFTLPAATTTSTQGDNLSAPTPPAGGFKLFINEGEATTTSPEVTLSFARGGLDSSKIAISNSPRVDDAPVERYEETKRWNLCASPYEQDSPPDECSEGTYTVYARFYTEELVPSDIVSASVEYEKPEEPGIETEPEDRGNGSGAETDTEGESPDPEPEESSEEAAPEEVNPEIAHLKARIQELRLQLIDLACRLVAELQEQLRAASVSGTK